MSEPHDSLGTLRDPATIRLRSAAIAQAVTDGRSSLFRIDRTKLDVAAARVAALTRERFPDLKIPFHSRWRHFEAGGIDRKAELDAALAGQPPAERARALFDLTIVSVLLDAGAGSDWHYTEGERTFQRSEGLGVATFRAFMAGLFAVDSHDPLRADSGALKRVDAALLRQVFQVTAANPMVGLEGRAGLLSRLGGAVPRPSVVYDRLVEGGRTQVSAADVLGEVLRSFSAIWTSGSNVKGRPAGDVWPHRFAGSATANGDDFTSAGWVPFHKLSQWLTYSLLEPLQWSGVTVTGLDALTGLPEYRNGGLLLDTGVIVVRDARLLHKRWKPADEFVIEWRALTVALLDELAVRIRTLLGKSAEELPLAALLEGGTWAAGRQIAAELRPGGAPPFAIDSDGTVF